MNEVLAAAGVVLPVLNIGLDDSFIEHGSREECLHRARLDAAGIQAQIDDFLQLLSTGATSSPARKIKA